jgi:hypothetical protein
MQYAHYTGFSPDASLAQVKILVNPEVIMKIRDWNLTLSQLAIFFEGRLDGALDL